MATEMISKSKDGKRKMVVIKGKKTSRTVHLQKRNGCWYGTKGPDYWALVGYNQDSPGSDIVEFK